MLTKPTKPERPALEQPQKQEITHASDCALHNMPALLKGECDCGIEKPRKTHGQDELHCVVGRCSVTDSVFIDGKFSDFKPELCRDQECCGQCDMTLHYGFFGGYGLGGMEMCLRCAAVASFHEDTE